MTMETESASGEHPGLPYSSVWILLLALTAVEVVLAYLQFFPVRSMLFILMALSVVKAALIVAYFMHLRSERRSLILSLMPILVVMICLLFAFFPDGYRLYEMRVR